jgi:hypothetical protein
MSWKKIIVEDADSVLGNLKVNEFTIKGSNTENTKFIKSESTTTGTTNQIVAMVNSSYVDGVIFDYVIRDNSGLNKRIGTVYVVVGDGVEYTDISTLGIGETENVNFSAIVGNNNISLTLNSPESGWVIKVLSKTL